MNKLDTIVVFASVKELTERKEFFDCADIALIAKNDLSVDTLLGYVRVGFDSLCTVYERTNGYRQHCSRNVVESSGDGFVSFAYACEHEIDIENDAGSVTARKDLSFSNSCGYYDSNYYTVKDYELHDADDIVTLHNGEKCHKDDAVFIDELGEYVAESDAVYSDRYGRHILDTDSIHVSGYGYVLYNDDDFFCCSSCDEYYHIDMYAEDGECDDCHRENSSITSSAREYGSDVTKILDFGDAQNLVNGKGVYVGIELECKYEEYKEEYKKRFISL